MAKYSTIRLHSRRDRVRLNNKVMSFYSFISSKPAVITEINVFIIFLPLGILAYDNQSKYNEERKKKRPQIEFLNKNISVFTSPNSKHGKKDQFKKDQFRVHSCEDAEDVLISVQKFVLIQSLL